MGEADGGHGVVDVPSPPLLPICGLHSASGHGAMMPPMRKLRTSINALCVFEVAARLMSFTRAADELFITQGGVSRQIRTLEETIGTPLFTRMHRSLQLTPAGHKLFEAVSQGLGHIALAMAEVKAEKLAPQLTVGATVSFAYFWLMPRLVKFQVAHPDIDIRVLASDQDVDFHDASIDVAFRCGMGDWPDLDCTRLFDEEIYPVCSPAYLREHAPLNTSEDLLHADLLHVDRGGDVWRHADWSKWFKAQNVSGTAKWRGLKFNAYPMIIQAALNGQGVALGWSYVTNSMVDEGLLVRPTDAVLRTLRGYFLVSPHRTGSCDANDKFRAWVLTELNRK